MRIFRNLISKAIIIIIMIMIIIMIIIVIIVIIIVYMAPYPVLQTSSRCFTNDKRWHDVKIRRQY